VLAVRCPECGSPGPVALFATERFRCLACRKESALAPEVVAQLAEAAAAIRAYDAKARQLTAFQQRMTASSGYALSVFLGSTALAILPFACLFGIALINQTTGPMNVGMLLVCGAPLVMVTIVALAGYRFMHDRLRRVRELSAAIPPRAAGEPARCHVCGGDVRPIEGVAFTRCTYCQSDNLTDPKLLAGLTAQRELVLEGYAARATQQVGRVHEALGAARRALLIGSLGAIPASCLCACPMFAVLNNIETDPYASVEYTLVAAPSGRCVATARAHPTDRDIVTLHGDWDGSSGMTDGRPRAEVPTFGYQALIGLEVQDPNGDEASLTVEHVYGAAGTGTNRATFRRADGSTRTHSLEGLCLIESAPAPVAPVPLELERWPEHMDR